MKQLIVDGNTALYGIIGNPVNHSFSPDMQTRAFQHLALNAVYLPFPVMENDLPRILDAFKLLKVKGFNITIPYKEKIIPFLDSLSAEAKLLSSVNTVKWTEQGWKGFSTDGTGFIRSLGALDLDLKGKRVMLLGAGGAAKAIAVSLANAGIVHLVIVNRTPERADALAEMVAFCNENVEISCNPDKPLPCDLIVNSTSVGMKNGGCPLDNDQVELCGAVVDIIYNPSRTTLLREAQKRGIPNLNGIGMLLYQGVESFEIWTDQKAPIHVMEESLNKSLAIG